MDKPKCKYCGGYLIVPSWTKCDDRECSRRIRKRKMKAKKEEVKEKLRRRKRLGFDKSKINESKCYESSFYCDWRFFRRYKGQVLCENHLLLKLHEEGIDIKRMDVLKEYPRVR